MGFLDKAVKAAAQAKNQIDDVREARAQNAVQPVQHGPLPDHERQVLERAQALGALNPFALLTSAEASAAVGAEPFLREMVLDNAVDDDRVPVEGVGHQAYLVSDYLWVLYGPILFYVNGFTPEGPLPVDACAQVARQVWHGWS